MNSPRYPPAGLLVEHGQARVAIDGGPGAEPDGPLAAWLVTDQRAELISQLRGIGGGCRGGELSEGPPIHKNGSTLGLRLGVNPDSHPWADAADGGPGAR